MENINVAETATQELDSSAVKEFPIDKSNLKKALDEAKQLDKSEFSSNKLESHDENVVIPLLKEELDNLKTYGESIRKNIGSYHGKIQQAAIDSLAKCLGIRQKFFKTDNTLLQDKIYAALYEKAMNEPFKKKRKNTTEYHLISRIYRGEERRQASSDALILERANKAGQTEQTFAAWVLSEGGLDEIRRKITKVRRKEKPAKTPKIDKYKVSERFFSALNEMDSAELVIHIKSVGRERLSDVIGEWNIPTTGKLTPIIIRPLIDGSYSIARFDMHLGEKAPPKNDYL
ncbi:MULTISPECIES: hypothetical protein [Burkholderiaceae]|uniref:Uncharacterized protein n=2 Tax=Burkholderiaceae TaxID=119060 RepID=A0ABX5MX29_9BURK|nr:MULTISPECIES: hypothetical protein [Burkholderiaceae]MCW3698100.1 hypothetical protein [Burkholderia cenocepacia]MCW3705954.1 hypothetical protein [Burkholderia cenocepacia]MCW3714194.1 hypothetical protein [Burkholderia cenocepacia]MCW3722260.1 hypothetical protein [Burkholderia cenocepacia]MCW3730602.1 hypothetical protein [Burkholderia cenocepacia]